MTEDAGAAQAGKSTGVPAYAHALVFLGLWGLLLAVLNMFSLAHPTQHISWGGLLTFEMTNAAFGEALDGFHFEVLGDSLFIAGCTSMVVLGMNIISRSMSPAQWFKNLLFNDTWSALNDLSVGGGQRTTAAWCLFLGLAFYFWYGVKYAGWIDVGVYSVTIALMASGFALNHASRTPPGDEKIN